MTTLESLIKTSNDYISAHGKATSFMLQFSGANNSEDYKIRNLKSLLQQVDDAYTLGLDQAEGLHVAYAKIGGSWHELCAREEDGTLTINPHPLCEFDNANVKRWYKNAESFN